MPSTSLTPWAIALVAIGATAISSPVLAQGYQREAVPQLKQTNDFMRTLESSNGVAGSVRPSMLTALNEAQRQIRANELKGAGESLAAAELLTEKTPYEQHVIARIKGAWAAASREATVAGQQYELAAQGPWLSESDKQATLQTVAGVHFEAKNYTQAAAWFERYAATGGKDPDSALLRAQSQYLSNDFAGAARTLATEVARQPAGSKPAESTLKMLADAHVKTNDLAGFAATLELLVQHYPRKEYWRTLLGRVWANPNLSARLHLDLLRLQQATGALTEASNFTDMAGLALEVGFPTEASRVMEQGFAAGVLGTGSNAASQQQLRDKLKQQAQVDGRTLDADAASARSAADGTALFGVGFNMLQLGQAERGVTLMEQGMAKGIARNPDLAQLRMVASYALAGQREKGKQLLVTMAGKSDAVGYAELVRYWMLYMNQS